MPFVAELSEGCWLRNWGGDPGRTVVLANAQRYKTKGAALGALTRARLAYPWRAIKGCAVEVDTPMSDEIAFITGNEKCFSCAIVNDGCTYSRFPNGCLRFISKS